MIEMSPQIVASKYGESQKSRDRKLSPDEQIALQLKERLKLIAGVESAWLEDLGGGIYIYVVVNDFSNATLHPVFDAQYDLESEFMHIAFHFEINPIDLEQMQSSNRIQRVY